MGTQLHLPKMGSGPLPNVYCGQTAGWIKMALGMEVGLGPGYIVLDGDPAPSSKRVQSPSLTICYFAPVRRIAICVSVCLSMFVCPVVSQKPRPNFTKFHVHATRGFGYGLIGPPLL